MDLYDILKDAYIVDEYCKIYLTFQPSVHVHSDFEISMVLKGTVRFMIGKKSILINQGNGIFINTNQLHSVVPVDSDSSVMTIRFSDKFVVPSTSPAMFNSCISPVINHDSLKYLLISKENPWHYNMLEYMERIKELYSKKEDTMALAIHIYLCSIWQDIMTECKHIRIETSYVCDAIYDGDMKEILIYIHDHLSETISIDMLSTVSAMGKNEIFRLFRHHFNCSPMEYINNSRITRAIELITCTDMNITEICYNCGFNSQSYFGKKFKEATGFSAKQYKYQVCPLK